MAKILVSFSSNIQEVGSYKLFPFYDGLVQSLKDAGNDVLALNAAEFLPRFWNGDNKLYANIDAKKLTDAVDAFAPDFILAFNNAIPRVITDHTDAPIALWDADSIQFYNDKEQIKDNLNRYFFFCFSKHGIENAIAFGAPKKKTHYIQAATSVKAVECDQDKNISFIGTMFTNNEQLLDFITNYPDQEEKEQIIALVRGGYQNINAPLITKNKKKIEKYISVSYLFSAFTPEYRLQTLSNISDLGLKLYGTPDWYNASNFFPSLAVAYQNKKVYSLKHNEDIYNSSKLCLNICHAQVVDGFPWRVMDILASNGCLLTDKKPNIVEFTKGYVDLPMYETPYEARTLAQKLLKDSSWRKDLILGSQKCIEEKGRWDQRFKDIKEIVDVDLLPEDRSSGNLTILDSRDYQKAIPMPYASPPRTSKPQKYTLFSTIIKHLGGKNT